MHKARDAGQDLIGALSPHKRRRLGMVGGGQKLEPPDAALSLVDCLKRLQSVVERHKILPRLADHKSLVERDRLCVAPALLVIELRFFGGLSVEETAAVLKVSGDTVMRDWRLAKIWPRREMRHDR